MVPKCKALIPLIFIVLGVGGCLQQGSSPGTPPVINPDHGHVPFEALITADPAARHYTFVLPDGTIEQDSNTLEVVVDSLNWQAKVVCEYSNTVKNFPVVATGTNPLPRIRTPIINGDLSRWFLRPMEQTLISFEGRNGRGIAYDGECHVVTIEVRGSELPLPFSIFYPPYEKGKCHAMFRGLLHKNSCIVYPCYTSIDSTEGLPYSPTNLEEGYPYIGWKNTNVYSWGGPTDEGQEIPSQTGIITVVVEDEFERRVTGEFSISIEGLDYRPNPQS